MSQRKQKAQSICNPLELALRIGIPKETLIAARVYEQQRAKEMILGIFCLHLSITGWRMVELPRSAFPSELGVKDAVDDALKALVKEGKLLTLDGVYCGFDNKVGCSCPNEGWGSRQFYAATLSDLSPLE